MTTYQAPDIEPLAGVDDILDQHDADPAARTLERYVDAVLTAYTRVIMEREARGDLHRGFTMEDYLDHRRPGDPSRRELEQHVGLWSRVMELIPRDSGGYRRRVDTTDTVRVFHRMLSEVAEANGVWPMQVTSRMYNAYAKEHPGIVGWRAYANRIVGREHWSSAVKVTCDAMYLQEVKRRRT